MLILRNLSPSSPKLYQKQTLKIWWRNNSCMLNENSPPTVVFSEEDYCYVLYELVKGSHLDLQVELILPSNKLIFRIKYLKM